jgi:hypothetical protein
MLPAHRRFIEGLERGASLRAFVAGLKQSYPAAVERYNACLKVLDAFRQKHIELSVRYILHQAKDEDGQEVKGTGGTTFVPLLAEARKETKSRLIE